MKAAVMVRHSAQDDERRHGNHPLFTPWHERHVVLPQPSRVSEVPLIARTTVFPRVGEDGLPVSDAPVTSGRHAAPEPPSFRRPRPAAVHYGVSVIDKKIHAIDQSVPPAQGGLWWTDCDVLVERVDAEITRGLGSGAWCPKCWELPSTSNAMGE